ncbi:MAG: hypothetical protein LBP19_00420 [Treponema sp.]|nr:hypothetical protein [Treponema sp.]
MARRPTPHPRAWWLPDNVHGLERLWWMLAEAPPVKKERLHAEFATKSPPIG